MIKKMFGIISVGVILLAVCGVTIHAQDVDKIDFPKLNKLKIPKVEKVTLENGMRLYLLEDKSLPIFNVNVRVNCGSYLEGADKVGLASVCGTVMRTGGTAEWTGDEIDELLEGIGGAVETGIGLESGNAFINVLSDFTDLGLEVMAEVLRRPAFDQDKIDLAIMQERTAISRRNDDAGSLARREYRKLIYGAKSPYAQHTEYETIDAISRDDLVEFHQTYYHPENVQMAIWGDFDKDDILAKIEQHFGDWEMGNIPVPPLPEVDYDWRSKVYYAPKADAKQSYIRIGHIGGTVKDPDYADRIVMNSILGGGFGSRVTNNVRTRLGLAYTAGGRYISNFGYPGYFFIVASTKPQSTVQAAREIIKQIKSMQNDLPTDEEMHKGKDGYLNSFVFNFDTRREVVGRMMTYDFFDMPDDFLQQEKERVEKVSPEDVMTAAKRNLRPDDMVVLVVGNGADFDEPLEALGLGPVDTIDITIPSGEPEAELTITPENLEKGKAILTLAVEAAGGLGNFKQISSLQRTSTMTLVMGPQELPVALKSLREYPGKHRTEMNFMGRQMWDIRNGDKGWRTDQMSGELVEMTPDELQKDDQESARNPVTIFRNLDAPYYQAVYDGSTQAEGLTVEWVALVGDDDEPICRLGFAGDTYHLLCSMYWGESPTGEGMLEAWYSDYADVNGVQLPMKTVVNMNDQKVMQVEVAECAANVDIPADAFDKPQ